MNITIIDGHPDASKERLNHALADRYAQSAVAAGHDVRRIDVSQLDFPLIRQPQEFIEGHAPEVIASTQVDIAWADHIVVFFPLWMSDVPAVLKGYLEQTFRPGFALDYGGRFGFPKQLLKGKSARIVVTMGMPRLVYYTIFGAYAVKLLKRMLGFAGISPVSETVIGAVENASDRTKRGWFELMERLATRDGMARHGRRTSVAGTAVTLGIVASTAYLAYALAAWARYGETPREREPDSLMGRFMPNYEVRLNHGTVVHAPASVTFSAIRLSDFERSPIVRFLFSLRDLVMRSKHDANQSSSLPFDKLTSIGWGVLCMDPGKEIVIGTVTKPWKADAHFRPLLPEEFASFHEPGYAKIALSIRVDEISSEHAEARTETRVQTTDPISRARFRRYWAFLSPGMAIIRRVLLQQIKAEAEAIWLQQRDVGSAHRGAS